jgi:hypothetical protein
MLGDPGSGSKVWEALDRAISESGNPDGVVSRITNDLDSYGSVQLTHFNAEEILSIAFPADGRRFASRGHTTSEVLLIKNFQVRN